MSIELRAIAFPSYELDAEAVVVPGEEYSRRAVALYTKAGVPWVLVYGDREHAANLAFVCGFDPRFEEALLVLGPRGLRALIVGNEGVSYVPAVTRFPVETVLCQSFSLMGQTRIEAPRLSDVLRSLGLNAGAQVAVVGWKYLEPEETDEPTAPAFVPALLVDTLRQIVGPEGTVRDGTHLLMHPTNGLRHQNNAAQIAAFAWGAERASAAVWNIVRGTRPGMREYEAAALMGYGGDPLTCHVMCSGEGEHDLVGLRSPRGRVLHEGDGITTAIGFQGGLCCRAGLLRSTPDESFMERYVGPYFAAICAWYEHMRIGATGGAVHDAVLATMEGAPFTSALNPGHLTSIDEWTHSPMRPGSTEAIISGMVFQADIIPTPLPAGTALNCEDTIAIADAALQTELRSTYPTLWQRIEQRRTFMREALGINLPNEVLPLSVAPAYLPPFWLMNWVCCVR
jgi:hypothetical protein